MWPLGLLFFFGNTVQGKFLLAELSMTILSLVGEMKEKRKKKEMLMNNLRPVIIEIMNVGKLHQNT